MPPGRRVHVTELSQGQKALVVIGLAAVLMALVVLTLNHTARTREPAAVEVVAPAPQAAPVLGWCATLFDKECPLQLSCIAEQCIG